MQKMQKFCFYRGKMWLLNSYKVTITDVVKNCQEKIEYAGKLQQGLQILLMRLSEGPLTILFLYKGDKYMLLTVDISFRAFSGISLSFSVGVNRFSAASDRRCGQFDQKSDAVLAESHTRVSRRKRDSGLGTWTKLKTRSARKRCWFCHIIAKYHVPNPPASPVMYGTGIS